MARVTIEDCLPHVPSRFALTILAAKRTRQLMAGARELVDAKNKAPVLSLREIAASKVRFEKNPEASGHTGIFEPVQKL